MHTESTPTHTAFHSEEERRLSEHPLQNERLKDHIKNSRRDGVMVTEEALLPVQPCGREGYC